VFVEALGCGLQDTTSYRQLRGVGAIECDCQNEVGRIGQPFPKRRARAGDPKHPLTLIVGVGGLSDETLAHQCCHDPAQRSPLDLEHAHQIALHRWSLIGQLIQHIPLRGPKVVGT
jgi:hypothetical protein